MQAIIAAVDQEIARLTAARNILAGGKKPSASTHKRVLSPEAIKAISDAQKRRWAKVKRTRKAA